MKFTEALEKAYANPGKIFCSVLNSNKIRYFESWIQINRGNGWKNEYIRDSDFAADWQPVLQEVTWQEALEAWAQQDKTIKCILPTETAEFLCLNKEHVIDRFQSNVKLLSNLIYHGKWYILEG